MNLLLAVQWPFSDQFVERCGWVLIHSLWQFVLLGLLAFTRDNHDRHGTGAMQEAGSALELDHANLRYQLDVGRRKKPLPLQHRPPKPATKVHNHTNEGVTLSLIAESEKEIHRLAGLLLHRQISNASLCVPWNISSDTWWASEQGVEWEVWHEDKDHYCFRLFENPISLRPH